MNGASKETFLEIASDKKAAGLIYDALSEIHDVVKDRPQECAKRFVKRREVYVVVALLLGLGIGYGVLDVSGILRFIP
jgi:hypothetical protein